MLDRAREKGHLPPKPKEVASDVADEVVSEARGGQPERNGYEQAVHDLWKEQGTHGRLALLDRWRRLYPEQEFFPEWANRDAEDLPQHVRDKIGMERVNQGVALRDLLSNNDDIISLSKVSNPSHPKNSEKRKRS
jgi:hypothetical protein